LSLRAYVVIYIYIFNMQKCGFIDTRSMTFK